MRAATPVDRASVLRFLRAGRRRRKLDAMARFHISSSLDGPTLAGELDKLLLEEPIVYACDQLGDKPK